MCNHFGKNFKEVAVGRYYIADYSGQKVRVIEKLANGFYIGNNGVTYSKTGCVPKDKNKTLPFIETLHKLVVEVNRLGRS